MEEVKGTDLVIGEIYCKRVDGYPLPIIFKFIGHFHDQFLFGDFLDAKHAPASHHDYSNNNQGFCVDYKNSIFRKASQREIDYFYDHFPHLRPTKEIGYIW